MEKLSVKNLSDVDAIETGQAYDASEYIRYPDPLGEDPTEAQRNTYDRQLDAAIRRRDIISDRANKAAKENSQSEAQRDEKGIKEDGRKT